MANKLRDLIAANIRVDVGGDEQELRQSLKTYGWHEEYPALLDERGVVLVGHRRMKLAKELDIKPVTKTLTFGKGDAADAERVKLALISNIGFKTMTPRDRKYIAEHLYGEREWTMARIAEALNVSTDTVSRDLGGFQTVGKPSRPKGGRPKGAGRPKSSTKSHATPPRMAAAREIVRPLVEQGKAISPRKLSKEHGVSHVTLEAAVAAERAYKEGLRAQSRSTEIERQRALSAREDMLQSGLKTAKAEIAALRRDNERLEKALKLPPESMKRLQAMLRRFRGKDLRALNARIASNERHCEKRIIDARQASGCVPDDLWDALIKCVHPDGSPSQTIKHKAFIGLRERERALRGKPE